MKEPLIDLTPEEEASLPSEIQKIRMFLRQQDQQRQKEEMTPPHGNPRRWLMPRPKKTIPQDLLKSLLGKMVIVTSSDGTELSGQLVSVDQASVFVLTNETKRSLRVDELEDIEEAKE